MTIDIKDEIRTLKDIGYVRSSSRLLYHIRTKNQDLKGIEIRFFDPRIGSSSLGSIKYSCWDILGERHIYYFDIEKKEKFVNFLVNKFYEKNPDPERGLKKAFTRLLHLHRLHWPGEYIGRNKLGMNR